MNNLLTCYNRSLNCKQWKSIAGNCCC